MAAVQEGDTASLLRELRALILSQQQSIQELSDRVLNIESLSESVEEKLSDVQETLHGASGSIVQRRASSTITAVPPTSPNRLSSRSDDQHTDRQSPPHTAAASYSGYFVGDMINTVYIYIRLRYMRSSAARTAQTAGYCYVYLPIWLFT